MTTTIIDFTVLTDVFEPSAIITAVLATASILVTVYVAIKGARILLNMIRGDEYTDYDWQNDDHFDSEEQFIEERERVRNQRRSR